MLGVAISSTVIGSISDCIGRKPCILVCLGVGAVGAVVKYLARKSFWGFCVASFAQGLFAGILPVAMAYISDIKPSRKEKDGEIGIIVAIHMLGTVGGGLAAILTESQGLFTALFLGAALDLVACIMAYCCLIEPKKDLYAVVEADDEEEEHASEKIDLGVLLNIIFGALLDNIGSAGLVPIAMTPLAFTQFYSNFLARGMTPIMSQSAFKWISVMIAFTVIPGAVFFQVVFDKVGTAWGCVGGTKH